MEKKLKIIFDRDGVLNELHLKIAEKLGFFVEMFKNYHIEHNEHFDEDLQKAILKCFKDPQIFADTAPAQGFERLAELRADPRVELIVHSLSYSDIIAQIKKEWDQKHGLTFFHNYIDCFGKQKKMLDAFIQVEDCLENLEKSPAQYKILIDKTYNQGDLPPNIIRVANLSDAVDIIKILL